MSVARDDATLRAVENGRRPPAERRGRSAGASLALVRGLCGHGICGLSGIASILRQAKQVELELHLRDAKVFRMRTQHPSQKRRAAALATADEDGWHAAVSNCVAERLQVIRVCRFAPRTRVRAREAG
jgi:hypothetical protein